MLTFPPDLSFVIQIVSFCVLWFGLKRLVFDPFLHVLEVREARTSGTVRAAEEVKTAADIAAAEHERRLHEARRALAADTAAVHAKTQNEERQIVAEARARASADLVR